MWTYADTASDSSRLAITTRNWLRVRRNLLLRRPDLGLVLLDFGAVDGVLLLMRADLQLFQHEILRELSRLRLESRDLVRPHRRGRPKTSIIIRHRGHHDQGHRSQPSAGDPPHQVSET